MENESNMADSFVDIRLRIKGCGDVVTAVSGTLDRNVSRYHRHSFPREATMGVNYKQKTGAVFILSEDDSEVNFRYSQMSLVTFFTNARHWPEAA